MVSADEMVKQLNEDSLQHIDEPLKVYVHIYLYLYELD